MEDGYDLERFVQAQDEGDVIVRAMAELERGRKNSHWMWFVFPQVAGLGRSATSRRYAISGLDEARAYLAHPVLGERLRRCASILDGLDRQPDRQRSAQQIFGGIDAQKLQSSMTLFAVAEPAEALFTQVLRRYFAGRTDSETERLLGLR